jgi:hypothetical protein
MQKSKQGVVPWFSKSITTGKKMNRALKMGCYDNGIEERVGVIGHQQQGAFFLKILGVNDFFVYTKNV